MINYYIIDTETTGLKSGVNEINQISLIRLSDEFQITSNIKVAHPERASAQALSVQGKTKADLSKGVSIDKVIKKVNDFIEEDGLSPNARCMIGHNVEFDRKFIHSEWAEKNIQFPADLWLCTMDLMKAYIKKVGDTEVLKKQASVNPDQTKVKYGQDLCLVGIGQAPKFGSHSASIDCQNCMTLYKFLMDQNLNYIRSIKNEPHKVGTNLDYLDYDY